MSSSCVNGYLLIKNSGLSFVLSLLKKYQKKYLHFARRNRRKKKKIFKFHLPSKKKKLAVTNSHIHELYHSELWRNSRWTRQRTELIDGYQDGTRLRRPRLNSCPCKSNPADFSTPPAFHSLPRSFLVNTTCVASLKWRVARTFYLYQKHSSTSLEVSSRREGTHH